MSHSHKQNMFTYTEFDWLEITSKELVLQFAEFEVVKYLLRQLVRRRKQFQTMFETTALKRV